MHAPQDAAVPQRWFAHFYMLGSACNAACICWFLDHLGRQTTVHAQQVHPLWARTLRPGVYPVKQTCNGVSMACRLQSPSKAASVGMQCASLVALAALQCHLLRRWYETECIMVYPPRAQMHIIAYGFGLR